MEFDLIKYPLSHSGRGFVMSGIKQASYKGNKQVIGTRAYKV